MSDLSVLDRRPGPGAPRDYDFPDFRRTRLANDLEVILAHVPGRPLLQAQLIVRGEAGGGATAEPADLAGVTVLTARAMSEGTQRRDAVAFVEASERLGASLGAAAGWDDLSVHLDVPRTRLRAALALMAELALEPSFPEREVERLRERAPQRPEAGDGRPAPTCRARSSATRSTPPARTSVDPLGGTEETVARLDRAALIASPRGAACSRRLARSSSAATWTVCPSRPSRPSAFGGWRAAARPRPRRRRPPPEATQRERRMPATTAEPHRPRRPTRGAAVGDPHRPRRQPPARRRLPCPHGAQRALRRALRFAPQPAPARGARLHVRRALRVRHAPLSRAVRCAAWRSNRTSRRRLSPTSWPSSTRIREAAPDEAELDAARDYLVGVFPLRFESSAQVAAALGGLVIAGPARRRA